jgi:hypothetical protein
MQSIICSFQNLPFLIAKATEIVPRLQRVVWISLEFASVSTFALASRAVSIPFAKPLTTADSVSAFLVSLAILMTEAAAVPFLKTSVRPMLSVRSLTSVWSGVTHENVYLCAKRLSVDQEQFALRITMPQNVSVRLDCSPVIQVI